MSVYSDRLEELKCAIAAKDNVKEAKETLSVVSAIMDFIPICYGAILRAEQMSVLFESLSGFGNYDEEALQIRYFSEAAKREIVISVNLIENICYNYGVEGIFGLDPIEPDNEDDIIALLQSMAEFCMAEIAEDKGEGN